MIFLCLLFISNFSFAHFLTDEKTKPILEAFKPIFDGRYTLDGYAKMANGMIRHEQWRFVVKPVDSLPNGSLAQIVPEFNTPGKLDIAIYITPAGEKNPMVILEEIIHIDQINGAYHPISPFGSRASFTNPFHWAETFANAQLGSPSAMKKIIAAELQAINLIPNYTSQPQFTSLLAKQYYEKTGDYIKARKAHAEEMFKEASAFEKAQTKQPKSEWAEQQTKFAELEKHQDKLNDLIAKNDRKGVRKLLEEYLPWPLMEPTEKKMWRDWLEALENPDPANRVLTFRGLDEDYIPRNAKGEPYLMSTVLTKNQGNYTRRLRSLTTMRERVGVEHYLNKFENLIGNYKGNPSLTVMMLNHMGEAKGSPFLSSSNSEVARSFGMTKKAAILIDKRRLMMNSQNYSIAGERERLIPLIIFPDEILHLEESGVDQLKNPIPIQEQSFVATVEQKLGRALTMEEKSNAGTSNYDFVNTAIQENHDQFLNPKLHPGISSCEIIGPKKCDCIFGTLNALLNR